MLVPCLLISLCLAVFGQEYVPVIKDGVPVDTPEVQAAKTQHFEAYKRAQILAAKRPSSGSYEEYRPQRLQNQFRPQQQQEQYRPQVQQQYYREPVQHNFYNAIAAYSSAHPVDTPEVQQAKNAHFAALAHAQNLHRFGRSIPEDTPEVQTAKFQHVLAHAALENDHDDYYSGEHHGYIHHIPVITTRGVPVDTPAVKAARQQHLLAHVLAKDGRQYSGGFSLYTPVITPNGVPYDTPEVHAAKLQHFVAHYKI